MKIQQINPADLRPHKKIKHLHRWDPKDERFVHMVTEIRAIGIQQPLQISQDHEVIDGELRRQVAVKAKLETVPCVVVADDQISDVILSSLCSRRHYTKGQRAFILAPELEEYFQAGISKGGRGVPAGIETAELFAEKYGISARVFEQARQVHKIFSEDAAYAKQMEPRIFDEDSPVGLGAVIAGYAGQKSTKGGKLPKPNSAKQLALFVEGFSDQAKRFAYWAKFDEEARVEALPAIRSFAAAMPPDLRTELKRAIKAAEREEVAS